MKLHEYQAKAVFSRHGIKTPEGKLVHAREEAFKAALDTGFPCVVKSQILRGGRGKAGLVQVVRNETEAQNAIDFMLDPEKKVRSLLIEKAISFSHEIYLSLVPEPKTGTILALACAEGGVEIEDLARTAPEKIMRESIDPGSGIFPFQARNLAYALGFSGDTAKNFASIVMNLYDVFCKNDAELAEINPLFLLDDNSFIAGDGKLLIDDNALFRQKNFQQDAEDFDSDIAKEAAQEGIPYLQFDGDISLMCAGAGLTTTVYDLVVDFGGSVANYLEFGGPNYRKSLKAMELCVRNNPKVILIVTFGTIARADVMAEGISEAMKTLKPACPIVTCIRGTGEEKAAEILRSIGLEPLYDTEEAVRKAVELSTGGAR